MSDQMNHESNHELTHEPNHGDEVATEEWPTLAGESALACGLLDDLAFDQSDDEWAVAASGRGIRLRPPVIALFAVILIAAGFWGGAFVQKGHGSSGSSEAAASLAARFGAGGARGGGAGAGGAGAATGFGAGATGTTGLGAATTQGTTGTISVVDGSTLYVLTSTGSLAKVTLNSSTSVTRNAKAQPDELRPGDTVVVQGAAAKNGTVSATSVATTAAGVTTAGGGRGFGFGGGGAAPTGG